MQPTQQEVQAFNNPLFNEQNFDGVLAKIEVLARDTEHNSLGPRQEFELLRKCGALAVVLPGQFLDFNKPNSVALLKILKDLGKVSLSVGRIFEGHINALYLIHLFGTDAQRSQWYKGVLDNGDLLGVWNTQDQDGLCFVDIKSSLKLKGFKTFCSGAMLVSKALVTGNLIEENVQGWQMAVIDMDKIPRNKIDIESWKPLGMQASGSYRVDFTGYEITPEELLGKGADYFQQPYFSGGAIRFAAVQLGGAEAIAGGTIDYLTKLNRAGDTIQQLRIAKIMSAITAGNLWINQAGKNYDAWVDIKNHQEELLAFANMTRTAVEEIGLRVMEESNQCVGARGLMEPFAFGRWFRDLTFYLRQPAPDATRLGIAKFFIDNNNQS